MRATVTLRGRRVLVTGGAGFIGSHVVDALIPHRPARIVVVDDLSVGRRANLRDAMARDGGVRLHVADATRIELLRRIVRREKVDVIFSLATIPLPVSLTRPRAVAERITKLGLVAAELCRQGEFRTLVHCSSSEVYGTATVVPMTEDHPLRPQTPYAAAKAAADLIVRSYWETFGIDATIVRPFNAYGPRQNEAEHAALIPATLRRIREGLAPVIFGDGTQTRDLTFVEDTARAIVDAYRYTATRRRVLNVGSGHETSIVDLVSRLRRLAGGSVSPTHAPDRAADVRRLIADVSLARDLIRYRARTSLEVGLRRTVAWYAGHYDASRRSRPGGAHLRSTR